MSVSGTHECPVAGCDRQVDDRYVMCYAHWALVPRSLQLRVWQAGRWKDRAKGGYGILRRARNVAIKTVNEILSRMGVCDACGREVDDLTPMDGAPSAGMMVCGACRAEVES